MKRLGRCVAAVLVAGFVLTVWAAVAGAFQVACGLSLSPGGHFVVGAWGGGIAATLACGLLRGAADA